jgi:hypothetical protein
MKTAEEILKNRIEAYNKDVSDFHKFKLSSKELNFIFVKAMEEYASQSPAVQAQEAISKRKGMDKIHIYRFQAEQIKETFRMVANVLDSRDRKTCLDRDVMVSYGMIENALTGKIDTVVNRMSSTKQKVTDKE